MSKCIFVHRYILKLFSQPIFCALIFPFPPPFSSSQNQLKTLSLGVHIRIALGSRANIFISAKSMLPPFSVSCVPC